MKFCVFIIFQLCPWIVQVGDWALRWTEGNEAIQIAFVMLIFPLVMNGIQYYIIDIFIKKTESADKEAEETERIHDADDEQGGLLAGQDRGHAVSIDDSEAGKDSIDDRGKDGAAEQTKESFDTETRPSGEGGESSSMGSVAETEAVRGRT